MNPQGIFQRLHSRMNAMGYTARTVSTKHLSEIEAELTLRYTQGSFNKAFFQERLSAFQFHPPEGLEKATSIIIIAVPQPAVVLMFRWKGLDQSVFIPPTYDVSVDAELKNLLETTIQPEGYRLAPTLLPLKLLAVRSGLAEYGKNNIAYLPGRGSFFRLAAFFSDVLCPEDHWGAPRLMKRCTACNTCAVACPSKAIAEHRFLLRAERCLTFHNEHAGDFPDNVARSWHHCLFGCLACQKICPENKKTIPWMEERERFSEDETSLILGGVPLDRLPFPTRQKLERLCLRDDYPLLARNLSVLLTRI